MAGAAAKKAAKASASTASLYFPIVVVINLIYVLFRVLYKARSCSWWQAVGLLCTSVVYYVCYHGVVDAARMGVPGGIYFDLMVVTLVAQFVATFSSYGWYILLLVPGYYSCSAGMWVFRQLGGWMKSQQQETDPEETQRELKRQAKKERKAARGPKMQLRR